MERQSIAFRHCFGDDGWGLDPGDQQPHRQNLSGTPQQSYLERLDADALEDSFHHVVATVLHEPAYRNWR